MSLRDLIIIALVLGGSLVALRRPWVGVMVWTWLSIMNPHRYTWGWAYDMPLAAIAAGSTLLGLVATRERESPFKAGVVGVLLAFMAWMTLSWLLGLDPGNDYWQWSKVMKIDFMILVALALLHSKRHIFALAWVVVGSLALLGAKGGVFTLLTGGGNRVWGPPGSFIEDNNGFALALVMTIPLLRFLQLQLQSRWARHGMTVLMALCAASALGSHSRGALLAISAMALMLWWRGRSRLLGGLAIGMLAVALVAFMPDNWSARMGTINHYEQDGSAMGRISAWWNAWNLAFHYPTGVGFDTARPELFAQFSPYPDLVQGPHSIYFQALGSHGFVGLFLFVGLWFGTWRLAGQVRKLAASQPAQAHWCADLASMCQVSLLGYLVGGSFLTLAYFDLPYNIMVLVVLSRAWLAQRAWEHEPAVQPGRNFIPGLAVPVRKAV